MALRFEGVGDSSADTGGNGYLEYVFLDQDNHELGSGGRVYLELLNVKNMYEREITTPTVTDPLALPFLHPGHQFPDERPIGLGAEVPEYGFHKPWDEEPQCVTFVHGWNVSEPSYLSTSETLFKRLWWQGYKGRFCGFHWWTLTGYFGTFNASEYVAWKSGPALKGYVEGLQSRSDDKSVAGYRMCVIAHSQGNVVACSAIKSGLKLNRYLMLQAAIPAGCLSDDPNVNAYQPFLDKETSSPTPNLLDPNWGYGLAVKQALAANVTSTYSYFNNLDFALSGEETFPGTGTYIWVTNELWYKPDDNQQANYGNYLYEYNAVGADPKLNAKMYLRTILTGGPTDKTFDHNVAEAEEMMAFVARPRSRAAGAAVLQGVIFDPANLFDLNAQGGLSDSHGDHGGEFNRPLQYHGDLGGSIQVIYQQIYRNLAR